MVGFGPAACYFTKILLDFLWVFRLGDLVSTSVCLLLKDYTWNFSMVVTKHKMIESRILWLYPVNTTGYSTAQLHSTKPELRFCAGSNSARVVSEIRDGKYFGHWSRLKIRLNAFRRSTTKTVHPHHPYHLQS